MVEQYRGAFRMESAGSLTPALEGASRSKLHPRTTNEKGRRSDEARQKAEPAVFLENDQKTR